MDGGNAWRGKDKTSASQMPENVIPLSAHVCYRPISQLLNEIRHGQQQQNPSEHVHVLKKEKRNIQPYWHKKERLVNSQKKLRHSFLPEQFIFNQQLLNSF